MTKKIKMKAVFIIISLLASKYTHAQTFTNYTTADGLIDDFVNCLVVDKDDNIWFGTQGGLSYYDYSSWKNYSKADYPVMIDNGITAITLDSKNLLWIGTDFGVNSFDGTNWQTYTKDDGLASNRIKYIAESPNGEIWFGNSSGVSILAADGSWSIPFGGISFVSFDNNGIPYLGTALGGVIGLTEPEYTYINEDSELLSNKVRSIAFDEQNNMWIGTSDGLSYYSAEGELIEQHTRIFQIPPPDTLNPVEDVQIDSKGNIWVGVYVDYLFTVGGVSFYNNNTPWIDYDVNDGLVGPVVRRLEIDSRDIVWVATSTGITRIGDLTSASSDLESSSIEVFPNPSNSTFTIRLDAIQKANDYRLVSADGKVIKEGKINGLTTEIDVRGMTSQIVFLIIDNVFVKKLSISTSN